LDRLPSQRELLAPGLTLGRYARIMHAHAGALRRCEAMLAAASGGRPTELAAYVPRGTALHADLARLPDVAPDPAVREPARQQGEARGTPPRTVHELEGRYLGLRYVLEGATQGARVISRRLSQHLPELLEGRFAYWRVQQREAAAWTELLRVLAARPSGDRREEAAVVAAREAYGTFLDVLSRGVVGAQHHDRDAAVRANGEPG
jgi:heme oxygenase